MIELKSDLIEKGYSFSNLLNKDYFQKKDLNKEELKELWNDLVEDKYLNEKWRFRQRRYSRLKYLPQRDELIDIGNSRYFQHKHYNSFNGGELRQFEPISPVFANSVLLREMIKGDFSEFSMNEELMSQTWFVGIHQFRIISIQGKEGEPTPEGIHQDGHPYFAIHLINRKNINGGVTKLYDLQKNEIHSFTLSDKVDTLHIIDDKVMHAVTPIKSIDSSQQSYRDILVIEFDNFEMLKASDKYPKEILDKILN